MLSLAYSTVRNALQYLTSDKTETEDIDKIIYNIKHADDADKIKKPGKSLLEEGCYYKTGTITQITTNHVMIDNRYAYEINDALTYDLKLNDKVQYMAFLKDPKSELQVRKIISVFESWDNQTDNTYYKAEDNVVHRKMIQRSVVAKVIERKGRIAIVEPNDIHIDLSKVQSEFIPLVGDWLTLEALVAINDNVTDLSGEVLEVQKIKPLLSQLKVGVISKYDPGTGIGMIDKTVIFHKGVCEPGYVPCVGDRVVSESIESDQGIHSWRSRTVVPLSQPNKYTTQFSNSDLYSRVPDLENLLENKHGIIIDDKLKFNLNIEENDTLTVTIKNTANYIQVLQNGSFMTAKAQSQLSIVSPTNENNIIIDPSESISYTFKCNPRFIGISEELFIFDFKDFKIGRLFHITINAKNMSQKIHSKSTVQKIVQKTKLFKADEFDEMTYIPGIKPYKSPAFIRVRNVAFKVPRYIWDVASEAMMQKGKIDYNTTVGNQIPCLLKPLSFNTYQQRFHALLYLEEVAQKMILQQYAIPNASMRRFGSYLVLEVPGLAEKRPSLLVGDRAMISFPKDSSREKMLYEGCIHKITSTDVFLKFNDRFHQEYNSEVCHVMFKCSQTTIQRSHSAINSVVTRLGPEFLFPTKVIQKEPQVYLKEREVDKRLRGSNEKICHTENESMSSTCSSNNVNDTFSANDISANDISANNIIKTSSKRSVAERLFNTNNMSLESPNIEAKILTKETPTTQTNVSLDLYTDQIKKRNLDWFNKNLNYYQKEAVRNILQGLARPLPYVIFGPPGTGKTMTLCETILQIFTIIPESRLLIATPSNSSANLIAERLLDSGIFKPGDFVRLIARHCLNSDLIPDKLLPYCATAELAEEGTREHPEYNEGGPILNCSMSILGRHRITIGTCSALGILYNMGFSHGHFTHVLVDEAGQATEPEIMIPLNFIHSGKGQVVLAGDPMQLGPVVQSKVAEYFRFGESFLSRLLEQFPYQKDPEGFGTAYDPRLITKLVMNYRSLPEILDLPNSLFYDSELQAQVSATESQEVEILQKLKTELPQRNGLPPAIIFHGVNGENCRDVESPSWYNLEEAIQAYLYLRKMYKCGLEPDDIGIITPYTKQVKQIKDLLSEVDFKIPKISSVEGFQGQERKVIIISVVRSCNYLINEDVKHALGFVASRRRLNVAITRARALIIILGNPKLLALDPYWRTVLKYCMDHEAYTGCNFVLS